MMAIVGFGFAAALVSAALIQWIFAVAFERSFLKTCRSGAASQTPDSSTETLPAAILMSVRGADPSLPVGIGRLLEQDHPDFQVHVVVDHRDDPAWLLLDNVKSQHPNGDRLRLQTMNPPSDRCSLKCHSLVQAFQALPDRITCVALVDADVTVHSGWLRALTRPLADESVGAVTGAQWFEPGPDASWGSWWRSTWNGGALVPTVFYANPWAGSFAMRRDVLESSGLLGRWETAMVDDGPVKQAMADVGKRQAFAPSLLMVNRESCSAGFAFGWIIRMLTWSRLYEPTFWLTGVHAAFSNAVMLGTIGFLVVALTQLLRGDVTGLYLLAATIVSLVVSGWLCLTAYRSTRRCVAASCQLRGQSLEAMSGWQCWKVVLSSAPAYLMFGLGCLVSLLTRTISWRGIRYRIRSGYDVQRLNYQPFSGPEQPQDHSI
jgi:hypothetical protein